MKKIMILLGSIFCVWMLAGCPGFGQGFILVPDITIVNESSVDFSIRFHSAPRMGNIYEKYGDYIAHWRGMAREFDWIDRLQSGSEAVISGLDMFGMVADNYRVERFFLIQLEDSVVYALRVHLYVKSPSVRYSITDELLEKLKTVDAPFVLSEREVKVDLFSKRKESLTFVNKKDFGRIHLWDFQPNAMTSEKQFESFLLEPPAAGEPPLYFLKGDELFSVGEGDPTPKKINIQP